MTSAPTGTLKGSAIYVGGSPSFTRFTLAINDDNGQLEYLATLPSSFILEADLWANGGADANYIYWGCNNTPTAEDDTGTGGYLIALDEFQDQVQLKFDGSDLSVVAQPIDFGNVGQYSVKVIVKGTRIRVYINGSSVIDYTDITRTLTGQRYGAGARTGGVNAEHRLYSLLVYTPVSTFTIDGVIEDTTLYPYLLNGDQLPRPKGFKTDQVFIKTDYSMINGKTTRDIDSSKRKYLLMYDYLSPEEEAAIEATIALNVAVPFRVDDGNLQIPSVNVWVYIGAVSYEVPGGTYLSALQLELIEEEPS